VIRDDDHRLGDEPHATHLHRAHDHLGRLAGTDVVEQARGGFGDHAGDRGPLMRPGGEVRRQPGQGQVVARVRVVAQHDAVEPPVVLRDQRGRAGGVLPHPVGEAFLQGVGLFLRRGGLDRVQDAADLAADLLDLVIDEQRLLLHDGLGDVGGGTTLGAPL